MGFRFHRSMQLVPGVRLNFSKSGVGYSLGGRGMRVSHSPTGRVTQTLGIPGTGLSYVSTRGSRSETRTSRQPTSASPRPGWLAPAGEKALFTAMFGTPGLPATLNQFASISHEPGYQYLAAAIEGLCRLESGPADRARHLLAWAFASGEEFADHPFVLKYLQEAGVALPLVSGIHITIPLSRDAIGLAAAEAHQNAGDFQSAIATVERTQPTTVTALSLADLYAEDRRWEEVVALTDGLGNSDDATALLLTLRGEALRELGMPTAARECLREALKSRKRSNAILHRALAERASAYVAEGRRAMALKDLERILAEDSTYPGVREALNELVG